MKIHEASVVDLIRDITWYIDQDSRWSTRGTKGLRRKAEAAVKELCRRGNIEATKDNIAQALGE